MFFAAAEVALRFMVLSFVPLLSLVFIVMLAMGELTWAGIAHASDEAMTFLALVIVPMMGVAFASALAYFYVTV